MNICLLELYFISLSPSPPLLTTLSSLLPLPSLHPLVVISQLLQSLNSTSHLASDTAFLFPDGDVFLASRAILSTQCCDLNLLLYNREGVLYITFLSTGHPWNKDSGVSWLRGIP